MECHELLPEQDPVASMQAHQIEHWAMDGKRMDLHMAVDALMTYDHPIGSQ